MTKLADRPLDCACEGCWDARSVPGLERAYLLCDYPGSPDYGHVVYYRHACGCFSQNRQEDLATVMGLLKNAVTPDGAPLIGRPASASPLESDSRGWLSGWKVWACLKCGKTFPWWHLAIPHYINHWLKGGWHGQTKSG